MPRAKTPSRDHPRARPAARAEPAAAHLLSLVNGRVHARPSLQANLPGAGAAGRRQVLSCLHLSVALPLRLAPPRNRMLFSEAENLARYTAKLLVGPVEKNRNRKSRTSRGLTVNGFYLPPPRPSLNTSGPRARAKRGGQSRFLLTPFDKPRSVPSPQFS